MSATERGGLKAAFSNFKKPDPEREAELKLLGRTVEAPPPADDQSIATDQHAASYAVATSPVVAAPAVAVSSGLIPRPLLQREAVRQLSLR